jgi:predicted dehydrogenase
MSKVASVSSASGFFAQNQLEAWRVIDGVEIAAVCDQDPAKVEAARQRYGVERGYTDVAEMLSAGGIDAVDVATTPRATAHRGAGGASRIGRDLPEAHGRDSRGRPRHG